MSRFTFEQIQQIEPIPPEELNDRYSPLYLLKEGDVILDYESYLSVTIYNSLERKVSVYELDEFEDGLGWVLEESYTV